MSDGTEKLFLRMQEDNKNMAEKVTNQIETLTSTMVKRDHKRHMEQQRREKARDDEMNIREINHHTQTQRFLETLANRLTETERRLKKVDLAYKDKEPPEQRRGREETRPERSKPVGDPTTLIGQLMRGDITQHEYDRALDDRKPLQRNSKEEKAAETREREQFLLDRIYARRREVEEAVTRAKDPMTGSPPLTKAKAVSRAPTPSPKAVTRGDAERAIAKARENVQPMSDLDLEQMERQDQGPESPRRKREASENSKNKKRFTEDIDSQQMSDITYSDGSTFVRCFNPPEATTQAQASTDRVLTDIVNGEAARTTQRQADLTQVPSEEGAETVESLVEGLFSQEEEEIRFSPPTPGAMTELDLSRNEEAKIQEEKEAEPDPPHASGGAP